ncbi:DUF4145 domain-containing protein [Williamsia soli]|uniref:DUF4145 domain-containing protein n=1 Tax=Williamsia soli TaxID=364929 RepID=UPI001A9D816B|nr:DUF4145 domain-containing protein [Williamsia soli]
MIIIARIGGTVDSIAWLRCVSCRQGVVINRGTQSPGTLPFDDPASTPEKDLAAWQEVRNCLSVGANTAAVMMCRKLLFHIAVSHGLEETNAKGRAPSFAEALDHLQDEGIITKHMLTWVNRIKSVGNEANHELNGVDSDQANDIAKFTRQLMYLAFELPAMVPATDSQAP